MVADAGATSPVTRQAGPTSSGPASPGHTPGPWEADERRVREYATGIVIACAFEDEGDHVENPRQLPAKANAAYLVTAANAYPSLLANVARLREALRDCAAQLADAMDIYRGGLPPLAWNTARNEARAALAATGKG